MVGMRAMDGPDGGARTPSELIDNLRLRLSQLAENHPSAPRSAEPGRWPGEPSARRPGWAEAVAAREQFAGPVDVPEHDEVAGPVAAVDETIGGSEQAIGDERTGAGGDGLDGSGGLAGDVLAAAGDGGALGELDMPGLRGASEPYRPWFMSGEPGAPWWASGEKL
jgi:hypothetical protein